MNDIVLTEYKKHASFPFSVFDWMTSEEALRLGAILAGLCKLCGGQEAFDKDWTLIPVWSDPSLNSAAK